MLGLGLGLRSQNSGLGLGLDLAFEGLGLGLGLDLAFEGLGLKCYALALRVKFFLWPWLMLYNNGTLTASNI